MSAPGQNLEMLQQLCPENVSVSFFVENWNKLEKPEKVIVSCVANDNVWLPIKNACEQLWNIKAEKVNSLNKGFGVTNVYVQADDLGSDRWCAMIGAYHEVDADIIVIDCGSAITIDVLKHSGQHLGGYILPGLKMMKQSLGFNTAKINVTGKQDNKTLSPGSSTAECVNAGIYLAAVNSIEAVVNEQSKILKDLCCFLTGGDAATIAQFLSVKCVLMPDLVLRGLAFIAEDNQE